MNPSWMRRSAFVATILVCALVSGRPATAEDLRPPSAAPFELIAALTGTWQVREAASLRIVFEPTAGGGVMVERWMLGERPHSLTLNHLDGERLLAAAPHVLSYPLSGRA